MKNTEKLSYLFDMYMNALNAGKANTAIRYQYSLELEMKKATTKIKQKKLFKDETVGSPENGN